MAKSINAQFSEEREQIIMEILEKQGKIRITEITDILGIAPSTARLQLQKMHDKGMLLRTHGGAIMIGNSNTKKKEKNFHEISRKDKKTKIAEEALKTIHDGDYIALSSGTTTFLLASMLHDKKELTVVTDSLPVAYELSDNSNITVYICGGWIMHRNRACRGITAENFFKDLRVDKVYCSVDSINIDYGITSVDFDPRTESAVCRCGKECYVLADSTKFHVKPFLDKVMNLAEISYLISDSSLEENYIQLLKNKGIQVLIAN